MLLALGALLALGGVVVKPDSALAISGYATPGPAVSAQYPDLNGQQGPTLALQTLVQATRAARRNPKEAAKLRAAAQAIARKTSSALTSAARLDAPQTGSIGLLIAGIAALSAGGILRWRRGRAQA